MDEYTEGRILELETLVDVQGKVLAMMLSALRNRAESERQGVAFVYEQLRRALAARHFYWPEEVLSFSKSDEEAGQWNLWVD